MQTDPIQEQIIADFSKLTDWLERYEFLISLGKSFPPLDSSFKTERCALQGCQVQVWVCAEKRDGTVQFSADSDSEILRGIISLLLRVLNNRPSEEITGAQIYFLSKIGLDTTLSPARANGAESIIYRMKELASTDCA